MKIMEGGLSTISGAKFYGVKEGNKGLALIVMGKECTAAGVFTKNNLKAAPVLVSQEKVKYKIRVIVANSGNANCATGQKGIGDARKMCQMAGEKTRIDEKAVAVASTGIIGKFLNLDLTENQMVECAKNLTNTSEASKKTAEAIMTTDTELKELALESGDFKIAGIAKGAGMLYPNLATMLCFIITDADLSRDELQRSLEKAVDNSFNMISVDNDMSTNDMVILLSTNEKKSTGFEEALTLFCQEMAKKMVKDGEGVTKMVEIIVDGAKNDQEAGKVARHISTSALVKTAIFGNNPNWGRVAASVGSSSVDFDVEKMKIIYEMDGKKILLFDGSATEFDFKGTKKMLENVSEFKILVDLGVGNGKAVAWTGDFSFEYVKINAEYN